MCVYVYIYIIASVYIYIKHIYISDHWILSSPALAAASPIFEPAEDEPEVCQITQMPLFCFPLANLTIYDIYDCVFTNDPVCVCI